MFRKLYSNSSCSPLLLTGYHIAHSKGNNPYILGIKTYNFIFKSVMYKRPIVIPNISD